MSETGSNGVDLVSVVRTLKDVTCEINALRAENESNLSKIKHMQKTIGNLYGQREQTQAYVAELEAMVMKLEWADERKGCACINHNPQGCCIECRSTRSNGQHYSNCSLGQLIRTIKERAKK